MTNTPTQAAIEAAARALIERQIRINRKWDTPPEELEEMLPRCIEYVWRERLPDATAAIEAYRAAMREAGFVMVPVEPNNGMLGDGWMATSIEARLTWDDVGAIWRAMIAAAAKEGE